MNRKLSSSLPTLRQHIEYIGSEDLKSTNENDYFVISTESVRLPSTYSKSEYLWENFPNESGDQWQPLSLEENRPVVSPEKGSHKYLGEQKSRQVRSSSGMISTAFKAGSKGFRSHEDYNKAVENYSTWWNNMNVERSTLLSRERFIYCSDQDNKAFNKEHKRFSLLENSSSSTDHALASDTQKKRQEPTIHRKRRDPEYAKESHALDTDALLNLNQPEKSLLLPGVYGSNSKSSRVNLKYNPLTNDQYMKVSQGNEEIFKTKSVRPNHSRKNVLERQDSVHTSRQSSSESVRRHRPRKYLQSRRGLGEINKESPRRCKSTTASSKIVHSCRARSRNNSSDTSKRSRSSKLTQESSESRNLKIGSVNAAPGTARKKWIKTPMREKMSLRKNSTCRQTSSENDSDQKSCDASDSSSIRKWRAVLKSAKENGLLKKESGSSSHSRIETVRSLVLPRRLRIFDADQSAEEAQNRKNRHPSKSIPKSKPEVNLTLFAMEKIMELQREIVSLKLMINSKKRAKTDLSINSLISNENSLGSHHGSYKPRCLCSDECSLISAYLPILFSHECYTKKLKAFEEFHRQKLVCASVGSNARRKIQQSTLPDDGIDGNARSKSGYVVGMSPTGQSVSDKSSQRECQGSSPKLLSYKSVEQMPDSCRKKTPTLEKSTQTELSTPITYYKGSIELHNKGIQCNEQQRNIKDKIMDEDNKQTVWQFGPESTMGFTFKSTCNILEIPLSNSDIPLKNKSQPKDNLKFKISPTELKKSPLALKQLVSGKVSERVATLEESSKDQKDEETTTKLNDSTSQSFTRKISIEWPTDSLKSPSSRLYDPSVESVDEVDEKVAESPCKGPSKKKSKLMSRSRGESAVESKAENVTRQQNVPNYFGPYCNLGKKFCHRRRFHKSVAKPTPFKLAKSE